MNVNSDPHYSKVCDGFGIFAVLGHIEYFQYIIIIWTGGRRGGGLVVLFTNRMNVWKR